ncbi:RNA polymerase subunit RPABC4/transcription elongation factor Spt4 [Clostridiales Family XIII bacterium PM5-7]
MFCKNCGKLINDGDKFCSNCGEKVESTAGFAFVQETKEEAVEAEKPRRKIQREEFNWNLDGYPTDQAKPTEDIDFNWQSVVEEKQRRIYADQLDSKAAIDAEPEEGKTLEEKSLEEEIFEELTQLNAEEPTKVIEKPEKDSRVDKFYTYNEKNAAFQALLDQEYEKLQNEEVQAEEKAFEPLFKTELEEPEAAEVPEADEALEYVGVELARTPESVVETEAVATEDEAVSEAPAEAEVVAALEAEEVLDAEEAIEVEEVLEAEEEAEADVMEQEVEPEEEACPPSESEEEKPAEKELGGKLTFDDVFRDNDDDDDDEEEKPKKKGKALKVIAIILCVLIAIELGIIGIMYFGKGTALANKLNDGYLYIVNLVSGEKEEEPAKEPVATESEIEKIIKVQSMYNKNIASIDENTQLAFDLKKDYGIDEIGDTLAFANRSWYTDDDGDQVSYGDEIIGTLIKYFSSWVDLANGSNQVALDYVDDTSDLYEELEAYTPKDGVEYGINKLEIGEIRNDDRGFYIMTKVTKVDSDTKKDTVENTIIYMEPANKAMKISAIYIF